MARDDFRVWKNPFDVPVRHGLMNASETFNRGEIVFINSDGEVATAPKDDTEVLISDLDVARQGGVAANGPGAALSAAVPNNYAWINPMTGAAYTTGDRIYYYPWDQGIQFITSKTAAAGGASAGVAPNGADRGTAFFVSYINTPTPDGGWAIEQSAATLGTSLAACIVDVLDSLLRPVGATADGTYYVFELKTGA